MLPLTLISPAWAGNHYQDAYKDGVFVIERQVNAGLNEGPYVAIPVKDTTQYAGVQTAPVPPYRWNDNYDEGDSIAVIEVPSAPEMDQPFSFADHPALISGLLLAAIAVTFWEYGGVVHGISPLANFEAGKAIRVQDNARKTLKDLSEALQKANALMNRFAESPEAIGATGQRLASHISCLIRDAEKLANEEQGYFSKKFAPNLKTLELNRMRAEVMQNIAAAQVVHAHLQDFLGDLFALSLARDYDAPDFDRLGSSERLFQFRKIFTVLYHRGTMEQLTRFLLSLEMALRELKAPHIDSPQAQEEYDKALFDLAQSLMAAAQSSQRPAFLNELKRLATLAYCALPASLRQELQSSHPSLAVSERRELPEEAPPTRRERVQVLG